VYRGNFGPVYDNEKENWRILTNKEIHASVKNLLQENKILKNDTSNIIAHSLYWQYFRSARNRR